MGFSRQEHWSRLPFPSRGDLPDPGIKPRSPTLQVDSLLSEPPEKPNYRQSHQRDGNIKALSVAKVKVLVVQSCPTLCNPKDCSPPGSSDLLKTQFIFSASLLHPPANPSFSLTSPFILSFSFFGGILIFLLQCNTSSFENRKDPV